MTAKWPAIPEPTLKLESLRDSILSIKQAFEILSGQRGNPHYAAVLVEDFPDLSGPWSQYIPTITPQSGAFTLASATGRYRQIGKTVFVQIKVDITTNGSGAGYVAVSLPVLPGSYAILPGRENAVVGKMLQGIVNPGVGFVYIFTYDNLYPGGNGYSLLLGGVYESV